MPTIAEVVHYSEDSTPPITVTKPAAFAAGEILVAVVVQHANPCQLSDLTCPGDWVEEGNYDATISKGKVFAHVYNAADPATWNFGYKSSADTCLTLFRIQGADPTAVINVGSMADDSSNSSMDSPSVIPTGVDDLLICCLADHGNGAPFSATDPTGMTDRGQVQVSSLYMALASASEQLTSISPTGVRTWTSVSPTGTSSGTFSIAVAAPPPPEPDPSTPMLPPAPLLRRLLAAKMRSALGTGVEPGPYVVARYESWQSDGLGDGSAITTDLQPQTGDILLVCVGDSQSTTPPVKPGGWTEATLPDNVSGTNFETFTYWLANPATNTTYTWTLTGGRRSIVGLLIRGASTTAPFDLQSGFSGTALETASSTTHAATNVTTLDANRLLVAFPVLREFPSCGWLQATGWVDQLQGPGLVQAAGSDATTNIRIDAQTQNAATAGSYPASFNCVSSEPAIVILFAVAGPTAVLDASWPASVAPAPSAPNRPGTASVLHSTADPQAVPDPPIYPTVEAGTRPPPTGSAFLTTPRIEEPGADLAAVAVVSAGRPVPSTGSAVVILSPHVEDVAPPRPLVVAPVRPQPIAGTWLSSPRTDPTTPPPDTACPAPVITSRPVPAVSGSAVVLTSRSEPPTPTDSPPRPVLANPATRVIPGGAVITATRGLPTDAPAPVTLIVTWPLYGRAGQSALLRPVAEPPIVVPSELVGRPVIVQAGWRVTVGGVVFARLTHACEVPRPFSGITPRPDTGTTVYGLSTTARPDTGVTARPDTGVTEDPC